MLHWNGNQITYFGHSTFGLTTRGGQFALIDPWVMTNPCCPENLKRLTRLDAIFLTHGHTDHMGDIGMNLPASLLSLVRKRSVPACAAEAR